VDQPGIGQQRDIRKGAADIDGNPDSMSKH
jgi:hypothetical protein